MVMYIGLNPSTADETEDDNTIRICKGFAERWGRHGIIMTNLWAFRATDPKNMKEQGPLVAEGPDNKHWLRWAAKCCCPMIIGCWGAHGSWNKGSHRVIRLLKPVLFDRNINMQCLGHTKSKEPKHPLRISYSTPLKEHVYVGHEYDC